MRRKIRERTVQQIRRFLIIIILLRYSGYSVAPDEIRKIYPSGRAECDGATIPEDGGSAKYMAEKPVSIRAPMETHEPGFRIYPSSACYECRCCIVLATLLRKRLWIGGDPRPVCAPILSFGGGYCTRILKSYGYKVGVGMIFSK